jgi:hypothetical protein
MPPGPSRFSRFSRLFLSATAQRLRRWLAIGAWSALVAAGYAVYVGLLVVPPRLNPWAPLDVQASPDWLTSFRLGRAQLEPARCLAALTDTGMEYDLLPNRETAPGCGFTNAVRLKSAPIRFGAPLALSCPAALSFYLWERHALQPAAQATFGQRVVAVENLGSYACRNINRGEGEAPGNSRSRHATADAIDISAFTLASGKRIAVTAWRPEAPAATPEVALLQQSHAGACRFFRGVLGPDYNAAHRDHFHLETSGYSMCR